MKGRRIWEIGGFISGVVLIVFGVVALYMGINGYQTVGDELGKEQIVGGSDMAPGSQVSDAWWTGHCRGCGLRSPDVRNALA